MYFISYDVDIYFCYYVPFRQFLASDPVLVVSRFVYSFLVQLATICRLKRAV